jgi:hypothetical protein
MSVKKPVSVKFIDDETYTESFQMRMNKKQMQYAKEQAQKRGLDLTEFFLLGMGAFILWESIKDRVK